MRICPGQLSVRHKLPLAGPSKTAPSASTSCGKTPGKGRVALPGFSGVSPRTNYTYAFVVAVGGSFNANGVANEDDVAGNDNEVLTFTQSYTINSFGDFSSTIATTLEQGGGPCRMDVFLEYSVE